MMTIAPRRRWFRYSLRTLLASVTLVAVLSYWLSQPTILAHEFMRAFDLRDYGRVQPMLVERDADSTFDDILFHMPGSKPTVRLVPLTPSDLWSGRRTIAVNLDWQGTSLFMTVTRQGVKLAGFEQNWIGAIDESGGPRSLSPSETQPSE